MSLAHNFPSNVWCQFHHVPKVGGLDLSLDDSTIACLISSPCFSHSLRPGDLLWGRGESMRESYMSECQVPRFVGAP